MSKQLERQYPLVAVFTFDKYSFDGTTPLTVGTLPTNAVILGGFVEVVEAFDSSAISYNLGGAITIANTLVNTTGRANGTAPTVVNPAVDVTITRSTATDTTGKGYLVVEYVLPDRQNEVQP